MLKTEETAWNYYSQLNSKFGKRSLIFYFNKMKRKVNTEILHKWYQEMLRCWLEFEALKFCGINKEYQTLLEEFDAYVEECEDNDIDIEYDEDNDKLDCCVFVRTHRKEFIKYAKKVKLFNFRTRKLFFEVFNYNNYYDNYERFIEDFYANYVNNFH